ncbi:MAG: DEAD/DEAH box helicase [Nitrosomonas sp.]|nr:DEAD/DEAH box helicase [Nitrosomonas sp.]
MLFEQLGLSADILRAISDQGYTQPTPIQEKAIPAILEGNDVMGGAQTGTGKTAGFTLPMLRLLEFHANKSTSPARHPVRALILVPTRELALQVYESVKSYGKYLPLRSTVIYGGVNIDKQIEAVRAGVEILVATPGRLLDHIQQKTLVLSKVEILVLDEADRMLDMGFMPDIKQILQLMPEQRQNLMFSATFSAEIKKLANKLLKQPVLVEVAKQNSVSDLITHIVYRVDPAHKQDLLIHLIKHQDLQQVLIFNRTKYGADRLSKQLMHHGITNVVIHGDKNQLQRTQALNEFKQGITQVMVATDVAARGLDIEELTHVINFELPNSPEDYVHRIGRTGRAGSKGFAISLVSKEENTLLQGIEKLLKTKLKIEKADGFLSSIKSVSTVKNAGNRKAERGASEQNRKSTRPKKGGEVISFSGTNGKNKTTQPRNLPEDPLFTQPYVPAKIEADEIYKEQIKLGNKVVRGQNKQVAALFVPPVTAKRKRSKN